MSDDKNGQQTTDKKPSKRQTLSYAIEQRKGSFAMVATKYLPPDRLVKLAQLAITRQPLLADCTTVSVIDCLMDCARLGLEPHTAGGVWLVPFKEKGQLVCTKIVDYRGLIDVARRSGEIAAVHADLRCEHDAWEYRIDTNGPVLVHLRHEPAQGEPREAEGRGQVLGAYMVAKLTNGQCHAAYLTERQIEGYRAKSKSGHSEYSPWARDWDRMALKTACRRGVNLLPTSPEIRQLRDVLNDEEQTDVDVNALARAKVKAATATLAVEPEDPPSGSTVADGKETIPSTPEPESDAAAAMAIDAEILAADTLPKLAKAQAKAEKLADEALRGVLLQKANQRRETWGKAKP